MAASRRLLFYGFILIVSLAVRLYGIGQSSYWIDEMVSVHIAKAKGFESVFWDNNPFLYHLLLKYWVLLFGDGEAATRSLSVLFSVGTTATLIRFAEKNFTVPIALVVGSLHAIFPLSIEYAQETRMYAFFEFCAAINLVCFYDLWKRNEGFSRYLISVVALALSHFLAIVPLVIQALFLFFGKKENSLRRAGQALAFGTGILLFSYLISFGWPSLDWQNLKFQVEPQSRWPTRVLWDLVLGNWPTLGAVCVLIALFLIRKKSTDILFLLTLILLPLIAMFAGGYLTSRSVFLSRYFIFEIPYVIVALGLMLQLTQRWLALFLIVIALGTAPTIWKLYRPTKAPWNEAAAEVARHKTNLVYTTRTLAIETPYFERAGIKVVNLQLDRKGIADLVAGASGGRSNWVLDTYWGGFTYFVDLREGLRAQKMNVQEFEFATPYSDPIVALRISKD